LSHERLIWLQTLSERLWDKDLRHVAADWCEEHGDPMAVWLRRGEQEWPCEWAWPERYQGGHVILLGVPPGWFAWRDIEEDGEWGLARPHILVYATYPRRTLEANSLMIEFWGLKERRYISVPLDPAVAQLPAPWENGGVAFRNHGRCTREQTFAERWRYYLPCRKRYQ
jgi:hypothetical protein